MKNLSIIVKYEIKLNKNNIHKIVQNLSKELNFAISSLNIIFISEYEIEKINNSFLKHNFSTDVITFNYFDNKELDGEIIISVDDAGYYAEKYKVPLSLELTRLVIHGILHMLGYDDQTATDKKIMKSLENRYVKKFGNFNLIK
ncbi:MAG: rRNA maturation RNase YbeY [Bacteroidota bacterium]|nr:rRNA maturation RNase YbeY [Bacteroidota bacterium]